VAQKKCKGDEEWPLHFAALQQYIITHGHSRVKQKERFVCDVTAPLTANDNDNSTLSDHLSAHASASASVSARIIRYDGPLGTWLSHQRLRHRRGTLRSDREALMQALVDQGKYNY
jgi:hypothetical protein